MKLRRKFLATVASLAILSTALLTGCGSTAENTQTSAEETTAAAEDAQAASASIGETGILILSVNPEIQIDYDKGGTVTAITGRNEDGRKIAEACQSEIGKNCSEALKNLITKISDAGYFVEDIDGHKRNIVLQIEPGSVLPSDDFLADVSASTQNAVKALSLASQIVTIDEDDYDPAYASASAPSPYITLEKAQEIALTQANVSVADAVFDDKDFDHDDGLAVFELEFTAGGVEYEYDVDAVTGKVLKAEHKNLTPASTSATNYDDTDYGPNNDGVTDYNDTDYGPNNDGVTDYNDTDYGPNNDGVTDYGNTNYGSTNYDDQGTTDYGSTNYDDQGTTNYGSTNYDDQGTSNYGSSDYDD